MGWQVVEAKEEAAWFHEYVEDVLNGPMAPKLPANEIRLGRTEAEWFLSEPGVAIIRCHGGTIDDRVALEWMLREELNCFGIRQANFSFDSEDEESCQKPLQIEGFSAREGSQKTSTWQDIMNKAKRLNQAGNVNILRNGYNAVVAHVVGDHGDYMVEISRDDPDSRAITQWTCECPWDQYAWGRTRQWKKYEGRPCAHVLAAYWKSLATPLDESVQPGPEGQRPLPVPGAPQGPAPSITPSLFNQPTAPPSGPVPSPSPMVGQPTVGPMPAPGEQGTLFDPNQPVLPSQGQPLMAPPGQHDIIPPWPLAPPEQMQMPFSIPGARPPTPANPVQYPGATFSHWEVIPQRVSAKNDQFANGQMARIEEDTYGIALGKSKTHGAGSWREVKKNQIGEVLGQDPTTGWVEIHFAIDNSGPMEPFSIKCFVEAEKLTPMPNVKPPGPFVRRR